MINTAYYRCSSCSEKHYLFGSLDSARQTSKDLGSTVLSEIPLVPEISRLGDRGRLGDIFIDSGDLRDFKDVMEDVASKVWTRLIV